MFDASLVSRKRAHHFTSTTDDIVIAPLGDEVEILTEKEDGFSWGIGIHMRAK